MRIIPDYNSQQKKKASTLLSAAQGEAVAAETLFNKGLYRESVVHMYFSCFYLSHAFLVRNFNSEASMTVNHKRLKSAMNRIYGKNPYFQRHVALHNGLHELRNQHHYRDLSSPSLRLLVSKMRGLVRYVKFADKNLPQFRVLDMMKDVHASNKETIRDVSYDIYCPETYRHHTRLTFWQPPVHLGKSTPEQICAQAKRMLASFGVTRTDEYVIGINSRRNQYRNAHLIMIDIDVERLSDAVERALLKMGGALFKSGRGFHFIGNKPIAGRRKWERKIQGILRNPALKDVVDKDHVEISLKRGYSTIRITNSPAKPLTPIFFKESKEKKRNKISLTS